MKLSAGLQVVLGILAEYASWSLAIYKKFTTDTDGIIIPHPSPNFAFEISLIVIGLAIVAPSI